MSQRHYEVHFGHPCLGALVHGSRLRRLLAQFLVLSIVLGFNWQFSLPNHRSVLLAPLIAKINVVTRRWRERFPAPLSPSLALQLKLAFVIERIHGS